MQMKIINYPHAQLREGFALKIIILLFFIFCVGRINIKAQNLLEAEFIGGQGSQVLLCEQFGENARVVDTLIPNETGRLVYLLDENAAPGLYRLYFTQDLWLDLILGFEDVKIQAVAMSPLETLIVYDSQQNKALYKFYSLLDKNALSESSMLNFLRSYPIKDKTHNFIEKQLKDMHNEEQKYLTRINKKQHDSFVSHYLNFLYKRDWNAYYGKDRESGIKGFSELNWSDTLLMNSDAYTRGIIDFLMLYREQNAGKEKQIALFKLATDNLFNIISKDTPTYDFAFLYLMEGFEQFEMEDVIMHMLKYHSESCNTEGKLGNRLAFYKRFVTGAVVPDFVLQDVHGEPHNFYNESGEKTLLIFWATWCGHCAQTNAALKELYPQLTAQNITIISVSLDNNPKELITYLGKENFPWEVWTDYSGWESNIVDLYHLYATPTMFMLDENHKVLGKPMNLNQIVYMINHF